jgi:plasmid stabilization system protein ParE
MLSEYARDSDAPQLHAWQRLHPLREEFGPGVRRAVHGAYLILYTHRDHQAVIERVVHEARDPDGLVDE